MAATAPVPARSARCSSPASSCPARPPAGGAAAAERSAGRAIAGGAGALGAAADGCPRQQPWAGAGGLRPRRGCLPGCGWPRGPARGDGWVWLPLVLPALPLADGQYRLALYAWLDGDWWTVLWGHLLWVVPWMLFILRPAWRQRDPRLTVVARTLGWGSTRIFWLLTLPSLTRPLLTALAVGFSVSIAQYLPTLWLGAGRIPTLTSQAVALSSGGEAQTLAAQALWQLLLPAVCFTLTALLAWLARPLSTRTSLVLTVNHLTLSVRRQPLLREVAFSVAPGEVLTLMGPSGSGKSTLFAWMIGALSGDFRARGELWLNERRCDTLPTEHRRIGILFQDPLLFDHFSVGQNLQLALPENVRGEARKTAVEEALSRAGLAGFAPRDPATLSGGQRARVSLLRALLARPEALLLDEPFSRLDASLRAGFRRWVFEELARQAIPAILVTHDREDCPPTGRCLAMERWQ